MPRPKAGRPTRWEQQQLLLDQAMQYMHRAAESAGLVDSKPYTTYAMYVQLVRDAAIDLEKHYNHRMSKHDLALDRKDAWAVGKDKCYCCYSSAEHIPLVTTYVLYDRKMARADEPWNWIRLCRDCAKTLYGDGNLKHRLWLKHENDPHEYHWETANSWFRLRPCNYRKKTNWITKAYPLPVRYRLKPDEVPPSLHEENQH